jgi:hypothetical protein
MASGRAVVVDRWAPLRWLGLGLMLGLLVVAFLAAWIPEHALDAGTIAVPIGVGAARWAERGR